MDIQWTSLVDFLWTWICGYPMDIFGRFSVDTNMWTICEYPVDIFARFFVDINMWTICGYSERFLIDFQWT